LHWYLNASYNCLFYSPVPPEQSLQVMQILDGIYRRQDAGSEIKIQSGFDSI